MELTTEALDLSVLRRRCVFRSQSPVASHDCLRQQLSDHVLSWRAGTVDTALHTAGLGRLQLYVLRYGAEVEIRPRPFDSFALVQMPLRGMAEIECDGEVLRVAPGQAVIVSPRRDARMLWSAGCEQLILKVPCELNAPGERLPAAALIASWSLHHWGRLMQQILELQAESAETPLDQRDHRRWIEHFEHSVALFLLTHSIPGADASKAGPTQALRAIEHYLQSHLGAPIALEDMARAGGISVRTLNVLCNRVHSESPMVWLRRLRLAAARERLMHDSRASVTDAALQFGFGNLGRFSAYYRERYGELPHLTVRQRQ